MSLTQRLDLRQSQTLVMTPQLQQAIKLLQLSNMELAAYVESEIEQNPLIDRDEGDAGPLDSGLGIDGADPGEGPLPDPAGDVAGLTASDRMPAAGDEPVEADTENVWSSADTLDPGGAGESPWGARNRGFDEDEPDLERTLAGDKTLSQHLEEQLAVTVSDPGDRLIGRHLIDGLDETGYLTTETAEIARLLGAEESRVEAVLKALQGFDPPGVFARSLKECLALQLADRDRLDPAMQALIDNLDRLAKRDFQGLMRACGVDQADLTDMIAEIRTLDPKPGLAFEPDTTQTVVPDIILRPRQDGGWHIEINADTLPRVLVNQRYYKELSRAAMSRSDREYLSERFQAASWLVKSLHQRQTTILKVAEAILRQQEAFFYYGVQYLRPLVLRDIAEEIGMHESTVSRVTTNKFMATPRGTFELKYFFTAAISSASGGASLSAESVRHRIRSLIDAETPDAILSDDRLVEILRGEGIDIARRTVAKYREAMRIPSSVQRRRDKSMAF